MSILTLRNESPSREQSSSDSEQTTCESLDKQQEGNAGWADSIAKILNTTKPKTKKVLVLARAKKNKTGDIKNAKTDYGFEIDGGVEDGKPSEELIAKSLKQAKNQKIGLRIKPSWKDVDRERALRKIATRGVVQLFNAVRIQQKDLSLKLDEAGPLDSRKEAVLNNINKRKFLDVLMNGKRSKSEQVENQVKNEFFKEEMESSGDEMEGKKRKPEWSVLKDDYLTNKKNVKHWDEEDASQNSESNEEN